MLFAWRTSGKNIYRKCGKPRHLSRGVEVCRGKTAFDRGRFLRERSKSSASVPGLLRTYLCCVWFQLCERLWRTWHRLHTRSPFSGLADIGRFIGSTPIKGLRPVCPNCHAMLHQTKPAMEIATLSKLLRNIKRKLNAKSLVYCQCAVKGESLMPTRREDDLHQADSRGSGSHHQKFEMACGLTNALKQTVRRKSPTLQIVQLHFDSDRTFLRPARKGRGDGELGSLDFGGFLADTSLGGSAAQERLSGGSDGVASFFCALHLEA